ncbi:HlyD family secretion protein [Anaerorhabdus sp.]|uniref:HlyD family secretion protein n=2 Tax=Anaerorhabdus sp. TaxID=1872524 RepID=UPI002FC6B6E8
MKKNKINVLTHLPRKIKIVMIFVCVICLMTLGFLVINKLNAKQVITTNAEGYVRTITLSKSSLDETVSATGNIESQDTSSVSTNLEYAVKEIYVQVGDTVEEGDIICKLDTSEIEKKIEKAKETQSTSKETLQTNYDNAVNAKETAWTSFSTQRDLVSSLNSIYQNALSAFQVAESSVNTQQSLFNSADSTLQSMGLQLNSAESSCLASGHLSDCSDDTSTTEYTTYQSAKQNYDNAKNNYDTAKQNLENAKTNSNYQNLYTAMTTAKNNLDSANAQLTKYQETFSSADAKVSETYKSLNNSSTSSSELEDLYEQLEDCTLTAKSSGKVTSLNATVGSKVNGSVATIQNTNSLKIVVSVDEYDIQKIKEGLTARITSDAVDEELTGIVSQISPVATAGSQGTSSGFQVEIDVTSSNSSLLIGMSAKV